MMKELLHKPFNAFKPNHVELYEDENDSPRPKFKENNPLIAKILHRREKMIDGLPSQIRAVVSKVVQPEYATDIKSMLSPEILTVRGEGHKFFGETCNVEHGPDFLKSTQKVADGICEIFFKNGSYLIGEFLCGKLSKEFVYVLRNGNYIKSQKKKAGLCKMVSGFQNDDTCPSTMRNSARQIDTEHISVGVDQEELDDFVLNDCFCEILHQGTFFKGQITNGEMNGRVEEAAPGYKFIGTFSNGVKRYGKLTFPEGQYEGTFKNGKFQGLGKLTTSDGTYHGQFVNGFKSGEGEFRWKDGSLYKGEFKNDRRHGKGFYRSRQITFKGEWINDERSGTGYLVVGGKGFGGEWNKDEYEMPSKYF